MVCSDSSHSREADKLVFLCGARDFHAMDWYRSAKEKLGDREVCVLTDLIAAEGFRKLVDDNDVVYRLIVIDCFLLRKQSHSANLWRNLIKMAVFPFQVFLIRRFAKRFPNAIYHAHAMYYLFLAFASGLPYVGTPQGSDILIKPYRSRLFRYFGIKSLKAAKAVTVDSVEMARKVFELTGRRADVIQNGIDLKAIQEALGRRLNDSLQRGGVLSIRGLTPLYRVKEILLARNSSHSSADFPLTLVYPFYDEAYVKQVGAILGPGDTNLGPVTRDCMYELLSECMLVISIPASDSSPRSVYEAIFCGSAVAITYNPYYDSLPDCMKSRITTVDLMDKDWFTKAVDEARKITKRPFVPSEEALDMFDQRRSFDKMRKLLFNQTCEAGSKA